MTALAQLVAACDENLRQHAVPDPAEGRFSAERHGTERAFVLEAVYEGYLLHYGRPRAFRDMDGDLRLLAGDALYALGLERLARSGDLPAVKELADLISLCAWAQASERGDLAARLWEASAEALSPAGGPGARARVAPELARRH